MDSEQALEVGREIAVACGEGSVGLESIASRSSNVFLSSTSVIKITGADEPSRFDREVALAADLPMGLSAPVLGHGRWASSSYGPVQYVRVARLPGYSPVMDLPGIDKPTAVLWAKQATSILKRLHAWKPSVASSAVLDEPLDHGGFTTRTRLSQNIDAASALDPKGIIPLAVIDGLRDIAAAAPERASASVPVHADCHWENWLIGGGEVTALLDFEWARFGEPSDDWVFLAGFSGPHRHTVLETIADLVGPSMNELRRACEIREASYLVSDLVLALQNPHDPERREALTMVPGLVELTVQRAWQQPTTP